MFVLCKNKPEISSASFFGSKKQSTKVTKNTKMGLKRSGSSISSILSKQASNSKSSNLANTDSKASDQVEAPKPTRKRVMVSSDEEESGTEEVRQQAHTHTYHPHSCNQFVSQVSQDNLIAKQAVPSTKLPLKKSPKTKADLVATTPPASQSPNTVTTPTSSLDPKESPPSQLAKDIQPKKETKISAMKRKAEATKIEPQSEPQQPGLSLDEQIATMAKTKTVQKKVKKHFQNGSYMGKRAGRPSRFVAFVSSPSATIGNDS